VIFRYPGGNFFEDDQTEPFFRHFIGSAVDIIVGTSPERSAPLHFREFGAKLFLMLAA